MIQLVLMLGSFAWVISELAELAQGGYTTINSTISAIAFFAIAIGIFTLWPLAEKKHRGKSRRWVGEHRYVCIFYRGANGNGQWR